MEQILAGMSKQMDRKLPRSAQLADEVMSEMILEHAEDIGFAMPKEGGALATGSQASIEAMMNKAHVLNISKEKILETYKISRFAEATRAMGNAEKVFQHLKDEW